MTNDFEQLATETLAKIKGFGIKSRTVIEFYRRTCRTLNTFLEENEIEFSAETGQRWLSSIRPCDPITYSQYVTYVAHRRTVNLLAEHQAGKLSSWRIYPGKTAARPKTTEYLHILHAHEERLRMNGMAKATIDFAMRVDSDFLMYLEKNNKYAISDITAHDVTGYFMQDSFSGRKPEGVKAYAYKLKSFLTFLEETGVANNKKLSLAVPKKFSKQVSIVTVLSDKAVKTLKENSNKQDSSAAARNHAMILLALNLGVRQSDIIKIRMTDIDWKNDCVSFVQQKTGIPVTLPLLPEVGNAIMDYILHFRPKTSVNTIFVRHYAPYAPLASCGKITFKYMKGLDYDDCPQYGFHILRRTCATSMLKNDIPRSIISASIGQIDPNSVDVYLSADEEKMRNCAISLSGIECARGELN